jgi:hypothetical protein
VRSSAELALERIATTAMDSFDCSRVCFDSRAQSLDTRVQCTLTIDHTSIAIERTSRLLHLYMSTLDRTIPALECIFAVSTNKPETTKYIVFDFFLFIVIFLCLFIFQCLSFIFHLLFIFGVYCFAFCKNGYCFMCDCCILKSLGEA